MLIQKIFHVNQSINATKNRLGEIHSYRRSFEGVNKALVTADGIASFDFQTHTGFKGLVELNEIPTDNPNQLLFCSYAGNVRIAGSLEFIQIKDRLTEVVLTIDYTITSLPYRILDLMTGSMDRFINRQLRLIHLHLEGAALYTISKHTAEPSFMDSPAQYAYSNAV